MKQNRPWVNNVWPWVMGYIGIHCTSLSAFQYVLKFSIIKQYFNKTLWIWELRGHSLLPKVEKGIPKRERKEAHVEGKPQWWEFGGKFSNDSEWIKLRALFTFGHFVLRPIEIYLESWSQGHFPTKWGNTWWVCIETCVSAGRHLCFWRMT